MYYDSNLQLWPAYLHVLAIHAHVLLCECTCIIQYLESIVIFFQFHNYVIYTHLTFKSSPIHACYALKNTNLSTYTDMRYLCKEDMEVQKA